MGVGTHSHGYSAQLKDDIGQVKTLQLTMIMFYSYNNNFYCKSDTVLIAELN